MPKSLSDQQPVLHSSHCSHSKSTRENKELKLTLCNRGKALELTWSHQKRHISISFFIRAQTELQIFLSEATPPPKTTVYICLRRLLDAPSRDSTTWKKLKMKTPRAHWDVLFKKLPANSAQVRSPRCASFQGCANSREMSRQLAAPPKC